MKRPIPFGKYLLLERISVGGMAEVFKAKAFGVEGFERLLAIKRILPTMAEDEDFIEMFVDEAKITARLEHANVCKVFELDKVGSDHYIAMEYIHGKDLLQIQNRFRKLKQQMPVAQACFIVSKICEGLDYAHKRSDIDGEHLEIIHRDVSPQNVLVSYEGEVKIIDFGIAKAASRSSRTQAGVLKGKFGYMSPEQVRGLPLDRRSDIFAIGTVFFEMLTAERLFVGESDFSTLERVRNANVPRPSKFNSRIPEEVERIVLKALARDSADRWQWAGEMHEALAKFLASSQQTYNGQRLAQWMRLTFSAEISREQQLLEQWKKLGKEAWSSLSSQPNIAGPPSIGESLVSAPILPPADTAPPRHPTLPLLGGTEAHTETRPARSLAARGSSQPKPAPAQPAASSGPPPRTPSMRIVAVRPPSEPPLDSEALARAETEVARSHDDLLAALPQLSQSATPVRDELQEVPTLIFDDSEPTVAIASGAQALNAGAREAALSRPPRGGEETPAPSGEGTVILTDLPLVDDEDEEPSSETATLINEEVPAALRGPMGLPPLPPARPVAPLEGVRDTAPTGMAALSLPPDGLTPPFGAPVAPASGGTSITALEQKRGWRSSSFRNDVLIGAAVALLLVVGGKYLLFRTAPPPPAPVPMATLVVTVAPPRPAAVEIDGVERGRLVGGKDSASLTLTNLKPGVHDLVVKSDGFPPYQRSLQVQGNEVKVVVARFVATGPARLTMTVQPEDAIIEIDKKGFSAEVVAAGVELTPGEDHEIRVSKKGYREQRLVLSIPPSEGRMRTVSLQRERGTLRVETTPPGATVLLDGKPRGQTPIELTDVEGNREHALLIRLAGYKQVSQMVKLNEEGALVQVTLESAGGPPAPTGATADGGVLGGVAGSVAGGGEGGAGGAVAGAASSGPSAAPRPRKAAPASAPAPVVKKKLEAPPSGAQVGYLVTNSDPPAARVLVDGRDTGQVTPVSPANKIPLTVGRHTVTFMLGKQRFDYAVDIREGPEPTRLIRKLEIQ